ncbi:Zinc finger protein 618 [Araneus ventricosus]|uniref:Zinc finger protein 618 n=1 Tax=Araneus ventricosus TaxID=182803 RepID=A0A4Y2M9M1_ARAVE|nr:Zinc finger protein 618 [Araneus ventricosus]
MESTGSTSLVCSSDVAAFVDALETINYNEAECYDTGENVVICVSEPDINIAKENELSVTDIEDACAETGSNYFNPDTRKLKAVMQQLVSQKKAIIVKKSLTNTKGTKQFKSDVWNWFGDVRLFISESDADRLKIPYYMRLCGDEQAMICKVFVGCFRCSALFMYDAQKHSTSTLRYHVRACNRPKECIFVSEDRMDDESSEVPESERQQGPSAGSAPRVKRFRTDPRKQKEVIEQLFQKQKAVVTRKSFMNMKGNRRFKSDVWNWFGDIKLLISRSEAKQLKIPYYIRRCGDEQLVLSKVFVGCFKCMALFIHDSQKSTSTLRYHIRTCSRPKERKKRTTPNIIFFPNKTSPKEPEEFNDADAIPAHEKLLNFALSSESSLEAIKDPEFHKILQMCITVGAIYGDVNIDSLLCATPTLTSFILNDLYVTTVNAFYTEFQHSYGATYKLNIWIDEQMKSPFISVHCNYTNSNGQLKSVIIHTDDFDYESKTADNVREWFAHFLADQPVIPFKRLIAIDHESNLVAAFKDEPCIKCSVQPLTSILQLMASKGANSELPDFINLLSNCVDLVDYFERISGQFQLPEELTKCTDDKWTSILALFRSIDNQYENILNALNATSATHLLSVEKSTVSSVVEFFKLFEDAIIQLSSSTEPALNLVIPWVAKIQKHCAVDPDDTAALKQFKANIGIEVNDRLVKSINVYHRMATFLDPRFKKMVFGAPAEHRDACNKVKCLVKECMESPNMEELVDSRKTHGETSDRFSDLYSVNSFDTSKCEKAAMEEVDKYLAEPFHLVSHDLSQQNSFPVLKYWKDHSEMYPNLCRIAYWLLSCPASSIQENETFWSNNWLVNCPRFPIPADNVNKVLFVKTFQGL